MKKLAFLYILLAFSCSKTDQGGNLTNLSISLVSGNNQLGLQNTELSEEIVIQVTDENQRGVPGVEIDISGDGMVQKNSAMTDSDGFLRFFWTLSDNYSNNLTAKISENSKVFISSVAKFKYELPQLRSDGYGVSDVNTITEKADLLYKVVDDIRANNFTEIHSFLIIKDHQILLEEYFPGHDSNGNLVNWNIDIPHEIQSTSKSFRSAMMGIALDKGVFPDVNFRLEEIFSDMPHLFGKDKKNQISLQHILTMCSGIKWEEWNIPYGQPGNNLSTLYSLPRGQWFNYIFNLEMDADPGIKFKYNTGTSLMIRDILARGIGSSIDEFYKNNYTIPAENSSILNSNPFAAKSTPREMGKLGSIFLNDGKWKNNQIISKKWVQESTQKHISVDLGRDYGYQWWLQTEKSLSGKEYPIIYSSGNGGQFTILIKELELVVVFTGGHFGDARMFDIMKTLGKNVIPAFEEE